MALRILVWIISHFVMTGHGLLKAVYTIWGLLIVEVHAISVNFLHPHNTGGYLLNSSHISSSFYLSKVSRHKCGTFAVWCIWLKNIHQYILTGIVMEMFLWSLLTVFIYPNLFAMPVSGMKLKISMSVIYV